MPAPICMNEPVPEMTPPKVYALDLLMMNKPSLVTFAESDPVPDAHLPLVMAMRQRWVIGTPTAAAEKIRALAAEFGVDEVMVHPVAGALTGTPTDASPAREETLRLLAKELLA